jgi:hypothetical protein
MQVDAEGEVSSGAVPADAAASREASTEGVGRLLLAALSTFLIWRGSLLFFDLLGLGLVPGAGGKCRDGWQVFGEGHEFLNGFFRWDSSWYLRIAARGYKYYQPHEASEVAFYPLFPYLSRYLGKVLGGPAVAGLVITNLASVGAIYYLRRLGRLLFGDAVGKLASILLLVFPSSFFLTAYYTEGVFLCLATGSMYYYFRRQFLWCGLLGGCAMLSRSTGLALFGALALDLAWQVYRRKERFQWRMLLLLLIPAGLGVFMLMLQYQVGDPLAFSKVLEPWGRRVAWPWEGLVAAFHRVDYGFKPDFPKIQRTIDALCAVAFLAISVSMLLRRHPIALWAFVFLGTFLPLLTFNVTGLNRYVLVLFPAFLFLAEICTGRPDLERWLVFASSIFLCIYSLRFMECAWAG